MSTTVMRSFASHEAIPGRVATVEGQSAIGDQPSASSGVNGLPCALGSQTALSSTSVKSRAGADPATAPTRGGYDNRQPYPNSRTLPVDPTRTDMIALGLADDAWEGDAEFTVAVAGRQIGGDGAIRSQHPRDSESFSLDCNWIIRVNDVQVRPINDASAGSSSETAISTSTPSPRPA